MSYACRCCPKKANKFERPFFHSGDALNRPYRDSKTCSASTNYDDVAYCKEITKGREHCLINGKKKRRCKLFHNDRIRLGNAELVFSVYDESLSELSGGDTEKAELDGLVKLHEFSQRLMEIGAVETLLESLRDKARTLGANAVVGLEVTLDPFARNSENDATGLRLHAIGTAAKLEPLF